MNGEGRIMSDLISRQDAINVMCNKVCGVDYCGCATDCNEIKGIMELPSAGPEIIRCKDCKYWEESFPFDLCMLTKAKNNIWRSDETDFCSWAERREEE